MKKITLAFLLLVFSPVYLFCQENMNDSKDITANLTPTPQINKGSQSHVKKASNAIVIHKPLTDPAWGKAIQYHREIANREILHEFLFQDDQGVIRTAIFHESTSGTGYWEVWIWDQP
jgi:hypothetical protein